MKKITGLLLLALLASCGGKNSSLEKGKDKAKPQYEANSPEADKVKDDANADDDNFTGVIIGEGESDADVLIGSNTTTTLHTPTTFEVTTTVVPNTDQGQTEDQSNIQTQQTSIMGGDNYIAQADRACRSLSIDKYGDFMITSVMEQGRFELNSNVACLIRTAYTPKKVKVKLLTNMHVYQELQTYEDHIEFAIGDLNKCNYKQSQDLEQKIVNQANLVGCQAKVMTRQSANGYETLDRVIIHSCSNQRGYEQCNRFKKEVKTCLRTHDDTVKINFSKARELKDGETEVHYLRLDQKNKRKFVSDFSLYEITGHGETRKDHIKQGLRKDSFKIKTQK